MEAKAALIQGSGDIKIPLPFTDNKLYIGGGVDLISIGAGAACNTKEGFKVGLHLGVGAELRLNIKK